MDTVTTNSNPSKERPLVGRGLVPRQPLLQPHAPGQGFRVLQTRNSPAQLSLFLRPTSR
ncbi:MAG: hypothetical protein M3O01_12615 [Pseudomonadota bacterium]|nr:hypothetical protein [Pseudomonadota bacterium]